MDLKVFLQSPYGPLLEMGRLSFSGISPVQATGAWGCQGEVACMGAHKQEHSDTGERSRASLGT